MTYFKTLISLFLLIIVAGCQTIDVRGQFVGDEAIRRINLEKPNKEQVTDMIGSPTYIPDYSLDTWYYIQRSVARKAWLTPKVVEQRILRVNFSRDRVTEAIILNDGQNEEIVAVSTYTKTYGTEQTGIQKFVKNLGRFNKTTNGASVRKKKKK